MITYEKSLEIVNEYLRKSNIPLAITYSEEFLDGWMFCFDSKEYVETGEFSAQLAGNGPLLVDRDTGELHSFGTARPPKEYLEEYSEKKRRKI
ncbi:YrhB domain-containing protein [Pseudomonas sp. PHC1]|uniref:YrhB domain-containing protein n=1 Tax=Pseudomonas sp. PHC1 TaxID=3384759 RepID=UPI00396F59EB